MRKPAARHGATFLEICIAVLLIAVVLGPMVISFSGSIKGTDHTNRRVVAIALTNQALERFKSESFARLSALFGGGDSGAKVLAEDPTLGSELVGEAFKESVSNFHLSGKFEEKTPGRLGVLTIACRFPAQREGQETTVTLSKVVVDYARLGFEGEPPQTALP